jgi:hypothetical protein
MTDTDKPVSTNPSVAQEIDDMGWRLRNALFRKIMVNDQNIYYEETAKKNRIASKQVNRIRALLSLLTGIASALAALLVNLSPSPNGFILSLLAVLAVALPAFAAAFNTLADLYQWDRTTRIYDMAERTLKYAAAYEPNAQDTSEKYREKQIRYAQAALQIMNDEQAQWGLSIRIPKDNEKFVQEQINKTHKS